jgi:hypothetical protein
MAGFVEAWDIQAASEQDLVNLVGSGRELEAVVGLTAPQLILKIQIVAVAAAL